MRPTHEQLWRRLVLGFGLVILVICAVRAISRPLDGDFKLHWEFGRRFLAGEFLYSGGLHLPYPPFWAMAHAPFALLPMPVAKTLFFFIGLGALILLLWLLHRLTTPARHAFWIGALAVALTARYLIRDLAELGVNTLLVALTWLAIYFWRQKREPLGGFALGFAIALKCTPAIFAGYFLWKRQWRMCAWTIAATLLFSIAPIVWQGPERYEEHIETWAGNAWRGFGSVDPARGVLGPEPLQNMALRPALARYLIALPPEHPGRASHRFYFHAFDLSPALAGWIIKGLLLGLALFFLWWARRAVEARDDPRILWECSALSILMLLFSPITWGQHCVALLPAAWLICALLFARGKLPHWMSGLIAFYLVLVLVLSRDIVGRDWALLLASYHVETIAILALFAVTIGARRLLRPAGVPPAE